MLMAHRHWRIYCTVMNHAFGAILPIPDKKEKLREHAPKAKD
jgi:hypothetical protein